MGFFHIVGNKCEVELLFAEIIRRIAVAQPCELEREIGHSVSEVDKLEAAVGGVFLAYGF